MDGISEVFYVEAKGSHYAGNRSRDIGVQQKPGIRRRRESLPSQLSRLRNLSLQGCPL